MLELDETHQLGIQILNLKDLGYTVVRGAIPPDMLKEIRNAFDRKMVTTKPYTVPVLTSSLSLPPFRQSDCVFGWRQPRCWSGTAGMSTHGR